MQQMSRLTILCLLSCLFGCPSERSSNVMPCLENESCDEPSCEPPSCDDLPSADAVTSQSALTDAGLDPAPDDPDMVCEPNSLRCHDTDNAVIGCDASGQSLTTTLCLQTKCVRQANANRKHASQIQQRIDGAVYRCTSLMVHSAMSLMLIAPNKA